MSAASVISVVAALVILGIFLLLALNVQHITEDMEDQLELKVFLEKDLPQSEIEAVGSRFEEHENVTSVAFESKEDALDNMYEDLEEYQGILDGLSEDNPLPQSYILRVDEGTNIEAVSAFASEVEGVERVNYGENYVDALLNFNEFANILSLAVLAILTGISIFIIYNTIKLTVFSRRKEITIMRYVGATNWYIRMPFIIEGSLLGVTGAVVAVLAVRNVYFYLLGAMAGQSPLMMGATFAPPEAVMPSITLYFLIYGFVIGAVGSLFSIRKFLDA